MNANMIDLNTTNFNEEVLDSEEPVLVEFWAGWCSLCKLMAPVIESVANGKDGGVKVVKVNLDENRTLADRYGIRAVPTLLVFNQGGLRDHIVGRATEQEILEKLENCE